MRSACILAFGFLTIWACQTTTLGHHQQPLNNTAPYSQYRNLAEALRLHPSLQVSGSQGMEQVIIRQFQGSLTSPLYVINEQAIGNDYSRANQLLNMAEVKSIRVLKGAGETIRYGSQGSGGVIAIRTNTF